jgi:hypothetical protein
MCPIFSDAKLLKKIIIYSGKCDTFSVWCSEKWLSEVDVWTHGRILNHL